MIICTKFLVFVYYFFTFLITCIETFGFRRLFCNKFNIFWRWRRNSLSQCCNVAYLQTTRRYFYPVSFDPKLISSLKFLSNCKTMFWVISQEQHSIKTLEFTETNSYFHSFTYEKNIFSSSSYQWVDFFVNLLADRKAVDSTPKYYLLDGDTNQASVFSPCIRHKWVNMIDWSTKLSPLQTEPNLENSSFLFYSSIGKN